MLVDGAADDQLLRLVLDLLGLVVVEARLLSFPWRRDLVYQLLGDLLEQRLAADVEGVPLDVVPEPLALEEAADLALGQLLGALVFVLVRLRRCRCRDADSDLDAAVVGDVRILRFRYQGVLNIQVAGPYLVKHTAVPVRWCPLLEACAEPDFDKLGVHVPQLAIDVAAEEDAGVAVLFDHVLYQGHYFVRPLAGSLVVAGLDVAGEQLDLALIG